MKKPSYALLFFITVVIFGIAVLLKPQKKISEREQRTLNQFPAVTLQALSDGTLQAKAEKALADQFVMRDGFIKLQRSVQTALGMRNLNHVWIGNNQLYQDSVSIDKTSMKKLSKALNAFALKNKQLRFDFLLIPTANGVLKNSMFPSLYDEQRSNIRYFQEQLDTAYHTMDTLEIMDRHKDEYIYYKGDHHWTTLGAYSMFQKWQKQRGLKDSVTYEPIVVNNAFYGTLANASGIDISDTIEIYKPVDNEVKTILTYVQEQKRITSVYDKTKQYGSNPYEIFLGGNFERVDILTTAENERSLLLIKDSYANCFIPFLLPNYHKIIVIDPRYYYDSLQTIIKEERISDIMFLMNAYTMFHDSSLLSLIQEEIHTK